MSHDEELLQSACNNIVEVRGRQLHHYAGNYATFLEQRDLRHAQAASSAATQAKKIAELEGFVARWDRQFFITKPTSNKSKFY